MPPVARTFGAIDGVPVGTLFPDRHALSQAKVHRPTQPGICGSDDGEGAESIVLSGGYADDAFHGDWLVYTGQGGRRPDENRQVADQPWNGYNAALARSSLTGRPVRVSRLLPGVRPRAYRYEGLFRVERYWKERGQDGFYVWQFRLVRLPTQEAVAWGETWQQGEAPSSHGLALDVDGIPPAPLVDLPYDYLATRRQATVVQRLVRDTAAAYRVKRLHDHTCQVCGTRVETPAGPYAEAAHIRPLGAPHDGPDVPENLLCLCPNCHVRFDLGGIGIANDGRLMGADGVLRTAPGHALDAVCVAYHRAHVFNPWPARQERRRDGSVIRLPPRPNAVLHAARPAATR